MSDLRIRISVTADYRKQLESLKAAEQLRKCRSWPELLDAAAESAEVELGNSGIVLRCGNGYKQDSCPYDSVLAVTETRQGILLRLSHKRLLLLPVSSHRQDNLVLMDAMALLQSKCKYVFLSAPLRLPKVTLADKIRFHTRKEKGVYVGFAIPRILLAVLLAVAVFIGTVFVSMLSQNSRIEPEDATAFTAIFEDAEVHKRRGVVHYVDLELSDGQEVTVDGCCARQELVQKLSALPSGTQMKLLLHPKSNSILQIETEETGMLLAFDYAREQLWNEAIGFAVLGALMYAAAGCIAVMMVRKKY